MNEFTKELMRNVLSGKSQEIRDLILCDNQIDLLKRIVSMHPVGSNDIANDLDVSIQNASAKLKRLHRAGYLERKMITSDSGGIEYVYIVPAQIVKLINNHSSETN